MQSIKLKSRIGSDGILHLDIPVGITDKDLEVMIVFQAIAPQAAVSPPASLGWRSDFFERTAGSIQDETFIRHPQGDFEEREVFD
ncbi:MAG: hypothetical protein ACPGVO_06290 [Spirulinaceae cyanobacterium]